MWQASGGPVQACIVHGKIHSSTRYVAVWFSRPLHYNCASYWQWLFVVELGLLLVVLFVVHVLVRTILPVNAINLYARAFFEDVRFLLIADVAVVVSCCCCCVARARSAAGLRLFPVYNGLCVLSLTGTGHAYPANIHIHSMCIPYIPRSFTHSLTESCLLVLPQVISSTPNVEVAGDVGEMYARG